MPSSAMVSLTVLLAALITIVPGHCSDVEPGVPSGRLSGHLGETSNDAPSLPVDDLSSCLFQCAKAYDSCSQSCSTITSCENSCSKKLLTCSCACKSTLQGLRSSPHSSKTLSSGDETLRQLQGLLVPGGKLVRGVQEDIDCYENAIDPVASCQNDCKTVDCQIKCAKSGLDEVCSCAVASTGSDTPSEIDNLVQCVSSCPVDFRSCLNACATDDSCRDSCGKELLNCPCACKSTLQGFSGQTVSETILSEHQTGSQLLSFSTPHSKMARDVQDDVVCYNDAYITQRTCLGACTTEDCKIKCVKSRVDTCACDASGTAVTKASFFLPSIGLLSWFLKGVI